MKIKLTTTKLLKAYQDRQIDEANLVKTINASYLSQDARDRAQEKLTALKADPVRLAAPADRTKASNALDAVNGKATAHTYQFCSQILDLVLLAEKRLIKHNVPQNARAGTVVTALSAVPTANAYARKGSKTAIATKVVIERTSTGWFLTAVERVERYTGPGGDEKITIALTDDGIEAVTKNALGDFKL